MDGFAYSVMRISETVFKLLRRAQHGHNGATPQMAEPRIVAGAISYPKMEMGGGEKVSITAQSRP